MLPRFLILLLSPLLPLTLTAAETYNLAEAPAKIGQTKTVESGLSMQDSKLMVQTGQGEVEGTMTMKGSTVKRIRTLAEQDGHATAEEVFVQKDVQHTEAKVAGKDQVEDKEQPLHGLTLVRELTKGAWEARLKEGEPTKAQQRKLSHIARPDESIYPEKPVAVGESWDVDPEKIKRMVGDGSTVTSGTLKCTLVKLAEREGESCAVVQIEMDASFTTRDEERDAEVQGQIKVTGAIYRSLAGHFDREAEISGTMLLSSEIPVGDMKLALQISGPIEITEKTTVSE